MSYWKWEEEVISVSVFSVLTLSQKYSLSLALPVYDPFLICWYLPYYCLSTIDSTPALLGLSIILFSRHPAWHLEPSLLDSYRRSSFGGRRRCLCPPEYPCLLSVFEALPEELRQSFVEVLTSQIEKLSKELLIYFSKSVYKTDICTSLLVACHISYPGQELKLVLA